MNLAGTSAADNAGPSVLDDDMGTNHHLALALKNSNPRLWEVGEFQDLLPPKKFCYHKSEQELKMLEYAYRKSSGETPTTRKHQELLAWLHQTKLSDAQIQSWFSTRRRQGRDKDGGNNQKAQFKRESPWTSNFVFSLNQSKRFS